MAIFKLAGRKVVVSENGISKVLTAPCGVSYSEVTERWNAWVIGDKDQWTSRSFGIKKFGAVEAFEMAVAAREASMTFLLNRRLLPRIRYLMRLEPDHTTTVHEHGGLYVVRDPLRKNLRKFATAEDAKAFNLAVVEEWKLTYTFDKVSMIKIEATYITRAGSGTAYAKGNTAKQILEQYFNN